MTGATADTRPWTTEEDALLRAKHGTVEAAELAAQLGRTRSAVHHRIRRLGLMVKRRWTASDDNKLRDLWETTKPLDAVARDLGRTPLTTYWRAQKLGLSLGVPAGYEYLSGAAERTGFTPSQLRMVLRWAGVKLLPVRARREGRNRHRQCHYLDPFDVDEAVARWCAAEPIEAAARARGLIGETLRTWLRDAGVHDPRRSGKAHWRVPSEVIDQVIAERGGKVPRSERWRGRRAACSRASA